MFEIDNCYSKDDNYKYCNYSDDDYNKLLIPKENLYTGEDNKKKYIEHFTHDLLLNKSFQTKFLDNIQIIVDENIDYHMTKHEIILI